MTVSTKASKRLLNAIDAAAKLFAQQGYHGTNTREIARHAGISENTLFRYFASKEELFWTALESRLSGLSLSPDLKDETLKDADPESVLPVILGQLVDVVLLRPELLRLLAIAVIELQWKAETILDQYVSPSFAGMSRYMANNVEKGRFRELDPDLLTAALTASVIVYPEICRLSGSNYGFADREEAIRSYTNFWLNLLIGAPPRNKAWPAAC